MTIYAIYGKFLFQIEKSAVIMKTLDEATLEAFHDSYQRCLEDPTFFDVFYERFIGSSDEIAEFFEEVDLAHTKKTLKTALFYNLMASDGSTLGIKKLKSMASIHQELELTAKHYDYWLDSLMSVVEEADRFHNQQIENAWRCVMNVGIDLMKEELEKS
jgi:hemoglobin-like flavoprotein